MSSSDGLRHHHSFLEAGTTCTAGRRRLPPTPVSGRRSSSPRFLPTPPPPSISSPEATLSVTSLERRPSGRRLPRPPVTDDNELEVASNNIPPSNHAATSTVTYDNEWPSPAVATRKYSELRKFSVSSAGILPTYFSRTTSPSPQPMSQQMPQPLTSQPLVQHSTQSLTQPSPPQASQLLSRHRIDQPRGSLDHSSIGTPSSANAQSQSSSLSPSIEQVIQFFFF